MLAYAANVGDADDAPTTYQQAMASHDAQMLLEAMKAELKAHKLDGSWTLVPRTKEMRPIGCRWVSPKREATLVKLSDTRLDLWPRVSRKS